MFKREDGFTLIELLIVMVIFGIVLLLTANTFDIILRFTAQQSKVSETQIESIVGLELLRTDIEHAGYGLPWEFQNTINPYNEAASATRCDGTGTDPSTYNDSGANPPRAILSGNNTCFNGSDYLVIKSTVAARNNASQRWTYITTGASPKTWTTEALTNNDRVIVIKPKAGETAYRQLIVPIIGGVPAFFTTYNSGSFDSNFSPTQTGELFLIYGVTPSTTTTLRMPFNRADYYISASDRPSDCASGTGVLLKDATSHDDGGSGDSLPLLDCVADFQVVFGLDTNSDGIRDTTSEIVALPTTAKGIREQVKDITVSILTHEGKKDMNYTYSNSTINVGPNLFDLTAITDWQRYKWKVHTMVIRPKNLS